MKAALGGALLEHLTAIERDSVQTRSMHRLAVAHDASHYRLTPSAVIRVRDSAHLSAILRLAVEYRSPVTFRSGGTSLSGQASTEGLLLDTRRHFRRIDVIEDGMAVRVQPGATVRQVNARLARYGRKLGPDPASEAACTLGGVIANNSSGMACGIATNTYQTIRSAVLVLADGTRIDTADDEADAQLRTARPDLWDGLVRIRARLTADPEAVDLITRQYAIKNTMGYGLNAFIDHNRPVDILLHLVVGSEGTLAFVAEAVLNTVPVKPCVATGMLYFPSLAAATAALPELVRSGLATIELLDATSLRVAQRDAGADEQLRTLNVDNHAALLVEYQEASAADLDQRLGGWADVIAGLPLVAPCALTGAPERRNRLWHIRKDLYATVAGNRPSGTTALLEDIAVPVAALRDCVEALTELFDTHGYSDTVIFGHAKDGNIHFMLTERFDDPTSVTRYAAFTEDLVDLVLRLNGTLKAEHGTGRIMAPYVRRQFGNQLYEAMLEVKGLADPSGVLNPGVLLAEREGVPLDHLKQTPIVDPEVDACVECGYCEPVCPSQDLTLTPRQRIVVRREREAAHRAGDHELVAELDRDYAYSGIDTCAADGMCSTVCPVGIDTGQLVKRLRHQRESAVTRSGWRAAASHWDTVTNAGGKAMQTAAVLPEIVTTNATKLGRALLGSERIPRYSRDLPGGGTVRRPLPAENPAAVYVPSCIGTMFGPAEDQHGVQDSLLTLCARAGVQVRIPEAIAALCCGTPWSSKGHDAGYRRIQDITLPVLITASENGRLPIVIDASSCTEGFNKLSREHGLTVIDAVDWADSELLPKLTPRRVFGSLMLHPTCSSTQLGNTDALVRIGTAISERAVVPDGWGCCAFAGDRGMLHPELTASATRPEAREVSLHKYDAYASMNRTCEIGMSRATGETYTHILELLEEATR